MKQINCLHCGDTYSDFDVAHVCSKGPYAPKLKPKKNERIKTLCQEAFTEAHESRIGPDGLIRSDGNPYIFYEKFAELIVQACAKRSEELGQPELGKGLMKHFGVKE
jgi:hypothetical protein